MAKQVIEASAQSSAPREKVWDVLSDLKGWKDWGPWELSDVEQDGSPDPNGVGAVRVMRASERSMGQKPTLREQVTAFEPPMRFGWTLLEGVPLKDYQATITLNPAGEGTEIVFHLEYDGKLPGVAKLARPSLESFGARASEELARAAERR